MTVFGNTMDAGPHELELTLSNALPTGVNIDPSSALGIINDNAAAGSIQFAQPDFPVSTDVGTATVNVTRTGGTASGVSVEFATISGGTAVPGVDYVPTSGSLDFGDGVASQSFPITILPDPNLTQPVTIDLALTSPGGGAILGEQSMATVTINPVNSLIVTNTNNEGPGSLRQAILTSDSLGGTNTITFKIPGSGPHIIVPTSPLPEVTTPTIIDATTEPGFAGTPVVAVDGSEAGSGVNGLEIFAGSSAVFGLAIGHFSGSGILLASSNNTIQGDRIGTDVTGTMAEGNGLDGIYIYGGPNNDLPGGASNNQIGGSSPDQVNVISDNGKVGVDITGPNARSNTIQGNRIGTDVTGTIALPNALGGIFLNGASQTLIGGPGAARNLISGNGGAGIVLDGPTATGNVIQNNLIGTSANGEAALGNSGDGVFVDDATMTTIGGLGAMTGNVISGNGLTGVRFMGAGASSNAVLGNLIGTGATGSIALGNAFDGVFIDLAPNNMIGNGTTAGRNVISADGGSGLQILGTTATANQVLGNLIGTNATGLAALGNRKDGVFVNNAPGNSIGGTTPGAGNLVSANTQVGIQLFGPGSTGNSVLNNLIGTNIQGAPVLSNGFGIILNQAPNNTVSGNTASSNGTAAGNRAAQAQRTHGPVLSNLLATTPNMSGGSITGVTLTFSQPLTPQTANDLNNFSLRTQSASGKVGPRIPLTSAVYDDGALTVTLTLASPVPVAGIYRVTIKAGLRQGVTGLAGPFLDGDNNGLGGGTSITFIRNGQGSVAPGSAKVL